MGSVISAGPGRPGEHGVERLAHRTRQLAGLVDPPAALDDGVKDTRQVRPVLAVDLLQHADAAHVGVGFADQQEQRDRVDVGGGQAERGVGGAGADRGIDRQRLPAARK